MAAASRSETPPMSLAPGDDAFDAAEWLSQPKRRWPAATLVPLAVAAAIYVTITCHNSALARANLPRSEAEVRALMTDDPAGRAVAQRWRDAAALVAVPTKGYTPKWDDPATFSADSEVRRRVGASQSAIEAVAAIDRDQPVDWGVDYLRWPGGAQDDITVTKSLARALEWSARVAVHDGDLAAALAAVGHLQSVDETLRSDPTILGLLVRSSIDGTAERVVRVALEASAWSRVAIADLRSTIAGRRQRVFDATGPVIAEMRLAMMITDRQNSGDLSSIPRFSGGVDVGRAPGFFVITALNYRADMRFFADVIAAMEHRRSGSTERRGFAIDEIDIQRRQRGLPSLIGLLYPNHGFARSQERVRRARWDLLGVACDILDAAHAGRSVADGDDLRESGLALVDPFAKDGAALRLERIDGKVTLWSVGKNGVDETAPGAIPVKTATRRSDDLVIRLTLPTDATP